MLHHIDFSGFGLDRDLFSKQVRPDDFPAYSHGEKVIIWIAVIAASWTAVIAVNLVIRSLL